MHNYKKTSKLLYFIKTLTIKKPRMKKIVFIMCVIISHNLASQVFTTNTTPVGLEHNILFNAGTRYTVSQTGPALNSNALFDGIMQPSYTTTGPTLAAPTVVLIEGLPLYHIQAGAWVGWSTRYWAANKFIIEVYDQYNSPNTWRVIADYSTTNYSGSSFVVGLPQGAYSKLRFTFIEGSGMGGNLGVSELFFIHPEATTPYAGLLASAVNNWQNNGANLLYTNGSVGVGTQKTGPHKLAVEGSIGAREVKVETTAWADFVFDKNYNLPTILEVEKQIQDHGHLKDIPSAQEVEKNGIYLGEMNAKLLQKIEELTLYLIDLNKKVQVLEDKNTQLSNEKVKLQHQ